MLLWLIHKLLQRTTVSLTLRVLLFAVSSAAAPFVHDSAFKSDSHHRSVTSVSFCTVPPLKATVTTALSRPYRFALFRL